MRKTASYLNRLRLDVDTLQQEIDEAGCSIEEAAEKLSHFHVHDLKTSPADINEAFAVLVEEHKTMTNLIKSFRIARENYLEFF